MEVTIRRANQDDLGAIQSLFVDTINGTCSKDYNQDQIEAWTSSVKNKERWKRKIAHQFFLVAEIKSKIIGFGSLENDNYLDLLYVHKEHLRKGIANLLFHELDKESRRLGSNNLVSDVSITAIPFFKSKGFQIVKENKNLINEVEIINYHMIKKNEC